MVVFLIPEVLDLDGYFSRVVCPFVLVSSSATMISLGKVRDHSQSCGMKQLGAMNS